MAQQKLKSLREADQPVVTVSEVCRRHGLSPSVFCRWRAVAQGGSAAAPPRDAASRGSIVAFAVPWGSVKDLLPGLGDLTGKLLVDPMIAKPKIIEGNPFPDAPTSTAEPLQSWAPAAHVVKAFISISYKTLANPASAGGPISIPYAERGGVACSLVAAVR